MLEAVGRDSLSWTELTLWSCRDLAPGWAGRRCGSTGNPEWLVPQAARAVACAAVACAAVACAAVACAAVHWVLPGQPCLESSQPEELILAP
jgi:hypothetical protein